ncbi:hypothetical protein HYC85_015015 [Camellia sinensis]|uniref:Ribonuclease n=1 Tax=Camellia sinensis TaxID=4442 RepID=A0A7J7HB54_CAMSI|nr:hypothetical protein HYC85_015015 [Camellia sinensis]
MGSEVPLPKWASDPCIMGIDEAGRGPVLDSKTLKEEKREELFENLKADESIGWAVDVIDPREFSAKMLQKLSKRFPSIKFVADSLYPVVSGASIVAKVTRDRALRDWVLDETVENMHRNFGSGYLGGRRGLRESNKTNEDGSSTRSGKRQLKLSNVGFTGLKRKSEEIESSGKDAANFSRLISTKILFLHSSGMFLYWPSPGQKPTSRGEDRATGFGNPL